MNAVPLAILTVEQLPTVNAILNGIATVLLVVGFVLIKQRRETAHKAAMLAAFGMSVLFLASYVTYHLDGDMKSVRFEGPPLVRTVYLAILIPHIILAAAVPFLAIATIYLGFRDRRAAHRRVARWTFPIWLYVSVTGVVIYVMLYHLYPPPVVSSIMRLDLPLRMSSVGLVGATSEPANL